MDWANILNVIGDWIPGILMTIGGFSMLATLTANDTDNKICKWLLKIVNLIGMNFGKAANKDPQ